MGLPGKYSFYFVFFSRDGHTKRKKTVLESVESMRHTLLAIQCNFSIFGKGRHVDPTHSRSK